MHYLYLYFLPYCIGYDFLQSSHGFFRVQFRLEILPKSEYYPNINGNSVVFTLVVGLGIIWWPLKKM